MLLCLYSIHLLQSDRSRRLLIITARKLTPQPLSTRSDTRRSLDDFFLDIIDDLRALFDVMQLTLYLVDRERRELFSKFLLSPLDGLREIRLSVNDRSISGFSARYGKILNIADAYDTDELASISDNLNFDHSWDERSGFRTRQVLAVPILYERKYLMGILLLLNRQNDGAGLASKTMSAMPGRSRWRWVLPYGRIIESDNKMPHGD